MLGVLKLDRVRGARRTMAGLALALAFGSGCPTTGDDDDDSGSTSGNPASSSSMGSGTSMGGSSTMGSGGTSSGGGSSTSVVTSSSAGVSSAMSMASSGGPAVDCAAHCAQVNATCTGANTQYPNNEVCEATCNALPAGAVGAMAGNSAQCRVYHGSVAANGTPGNPDVHCPHAGPTGGMVCGSLCESFCAVVMNICTGANAAYATAGDCMTACNALDDGGAPSDTEGDSVQCRLYHAAAGVTLNDVVTHCRHAQVNSTACFDTLIDNVTLEVASAYDSAATSDMVRVQAGANTLSTGATLTVTKLTLPPDPGASRVLASAGMVINFDAVGAGNLMFTQPYTVTIPVSPAPVHPQLAEVYVLSGTTYTPVPSFYDAATQSVKATLNQTDVTVVALLRTLRAETGADVVAGRDVFMTETFGNESFFGGVLGLHNALSTLPPSEAVAAGVQIDITRVPGPVAALLAGTNPADDEARTDALDDPAITNALLRAGAVVGVKAVYGANATTDCGSAEGGMGPDGDNRCPTSVGITCALCHVTVAPALTVRITGGTIDLPVGNPQFNGLHNKAMNAGAILSLSDFAQDTAGVAALLSSWGAGRFDVRALPDNPLEDNVVNPTEVMPLWNFVDLEAQGYHYDWDGLFFDDAMPNNALASQAEAIYDLVMHANGAFGAANGTLAPKLDPTFTVTDIVAALGMAEAAAPGNDVTPLLKLQQVQAFQRSMVSPAPGPFNAAAAERGWRLFFGRARCVTCHSTPEFTGMVGANVRGIITATAPGGGLADGIKVPPLRGISQTAPYFHDGSAADLTAVIQRYKARGGAGGPPMDLSNAEIADLVEYLKSL